MILLCTVGQGAVMWMHNNRYFLAIGRGDQKILFAFSMYASLQFLLRALSGIGFQGGSRCVTSL
jgi:hypothetical protein